MSFLPPFDGLPHALARRLLIGGSGPGLAPARAAALAAGPSAAPLADALGLAVWEGAPFWPEAAALAVSSAAPLAPTLAVAARAVAEAASRPAVADPYFDRLAARRDIPKLVHYLLSRHEKVPDDPTPLYRLSVFAPMALGPAGGGELYERARDVFSGLSGALHPLGALTAAGLDLLAGRCAAARDACLALLSAFPSAAARLLLAEALVRLGDRDGAVAALAAVVAARPWDVLALGRLHDLACGADTAVAKLPGSLAVLLYSYNNARLLDATLACLADTDWGFAPAGGGPRLFALDNGSGDDTAAVLAAWRERLAGRLEVVPLPVNVGAPAARNWLLRLPGVRAREFTAFFDDDAFAPPDWLGRLGAAVAARPEAGVWGCRIVGRDAPAFVQCADSHLLPTPREEGGFGRAFDLASPWLVTPDWGQYAQLRPCATVTGCCHLFCRDVFDAVGDFDIRFSPTQYDDLDHDLRLLLAGKVPVCQGHLAVVHAKATGAASLPGGVNYGFGFANQFKLHHKYDDAAVARAADTAFAALAADAAAKRHVVEGLGLAGGGARDGEGGHGR
ncbi:glycosyltransferase family A protein [Solidesulfovibrio sp.]|uniref:glycosyltransferase family 2 protein n=1 Tax=Solidesulfovibrio sp. TaxID=2910990 RepID=UPI002613095B|nr:glycosyltransferase family A protein [Solidesulfovibrio sp.]